MRGYNNQAHKSKPGVLAQPDQIMSSQTIWQKQDKVDWKFISSSMNIPTSACLHIDQHYCIPPLLLLRLQSWLMSTCIIWETPNPNTYAIHVATWKSSPYCPIPCMFCDSILQEAEAWGPGFIPQSEPAAFLQLLNSLRTISSPYKSLKN